MFYYSLNGAYPQPIPDRIRLSNGSTRTDNTTFTEDEIADAGYVRVTVPEYNSATEYLSWDGVNFTILSIPPQPDWDNFNLQMMSNPRFNEVYNQCLALAPIVSSALPTALDQVTTKGLNLFTLVWTQLCSIGGATPQDKTAWGAIAEDNHLPQNFINVLTT